MYSVKNSASEDFLMIIHKAYSNCNFPRKDFLTDKKVYDF